jgi:hypothetical protein
MRVILTSPRLILRSAIRGVYASPEEETRKLPTMVSFGYH